MSRTEELRKMNASMKNDADSAIEKLRAAANDADRMGDVFAHAGDIMTELDQEFSAKTGITNRKDLSFLFVTVALLCTKWVVMGHKLPLDFDFKHTPDTSDRITDKEGDKLAENERKKHPEYGNMKDEHDVSEDGYRTVNQILFRPVPYDALTKIDAIKTNQMFLKAIGLDNLSGKNHRAYTMGHDPIFGWVFGTVNIMTRSITLKNLTLDTFTVLEQGNIIVMDSKSSFANSVGDAIMSTIEDNKRLPAAIFKQGLHFLSDKYTKQGLPIPFLSAEKAQELIEKGWNSEEIKKQLIKILKKSAKMAGTIALQFLLSFLINMIVKAIHLMMYEEEKDGDYKLYEVRTRKILMVANTISSSSNILASAIKAYISKNVVDGAKMLDIGGFIETVHRLVTDTKFINEIKREYILSNFEEKLFDENDWIADGFGGENMKLNKQYKQGADDMAKLGAKALDHVSAKVEHGVGHLENYVEKQNVVNDQIFDLLDSDDARLIRLEMGYKPLDLKTIFRLPAVEKAVIARLVIDIPCSEEGRKYQSTILAQLGVSPIVSDHLPSLSGDAAEAAAMFLYKISEFEDDETVQRSVDEAVDTLEIAGKTLTRIKQQTAELKTKLGEAQFRQLLFTELTSPDILKKPLTHEKNARSVKAVVSGKTGAGSTELIRSILDGAEETTVRMLDDSTKVYEEPSGMLQLYDTYGLSLQNGSDMQQYLAELVEKENINVLLYCVRADSHRFEDFEANLIRSLRNCQSNLSVYIVITACINKTEGHQLAEYIKSKTNHAPVVMVLEKDLETDNGVVAAYGVPELVEIISHD